MNYFYWIVFGVNLKALLYSPRIVYAVPDDDYRTRSARILLNEFEVKCASGTDKTLIIFA